MTVLISNSGKEFTVLSQQGKACVIQFTETGYTRSAYIDNARAGKVRDMYALTVYGRGYYGEFVKVPYWKQAKQLWQNMFKRCYCENDPRGYFGHVTVDTRWTCFANFLSDLPKLEGFSAWLAGQSGGTLKYNLDKDFRYPDNKVYSREACQFITEYENKAAGARNARKWDKRYQ